MNDEDGIRALVATWMNATRISVLHMRDGRWVIARDANMLAGAVSGRVR